jgi:hypothetical protein
MIVHYERIPKVYLYCAKIGYELDGCEDRNNLMSHIKTYPPELHDLLREKLSLARGAWINRDYLIPKEKILACDQSREYRGGSGKGPVDGSARKNLNINEIPPNEGPHMGAVAARLKRGCDEITTEETSVGL